LKTKKEKDNAQGELKKQGREPIAHHDNSKNKKKKRVVTKKRIRECGSRKVRGTHNPERTPKTRERGGLE